MREKLIQYLKNRYNVELLVLVVLSLGVLMILIFTPFYLHDWVVKEKTLLMWTEIVLLVSLCIVLSLEIFQLKAKLSYSTRMDSQNTTDIYNFYDERGELKLSVKSYMLYYIESADNYIQIVYTNADKVEKMLIRNTLKNIEWRFQSQGLVRCHRSYIVNLQNVKLLLRQEGEVFLDFGDSRISHVPVSKGYGENVLGHFAKMPF